MSHVVEITSLDAPELDVYARLTEAQLLNRFEPAKGMLLRKAPRSFTGLWMPAADR